MIISNQMRNAVPLCLLLTLLTAHCLLLCSLYPLLSQGEIPSSKAARGTLTLASASPSNHGQIHVELAHCVALAPERLAC